MSRFSFLLTTIVVAALSLAGTSFAQTRPLLPGPEAPLAKVVHRSWGVEDGLPVNGVLALSVSDDGYLWIGTEEGVVRFDGHAFRTLSMESVPAVPSADVFDLLFSSDGALWLATRGEGLVRVEDGEVESLTTADGLPSDFLYDLLEAHGWLWASTRGEGLVRVRGDVVETFGTAEGLPHGYVTSLARGPDGTVWVGTRGGLARIDDGVVEEIRVAGLPPGADVEAVAGVGGVVWLGIGGAEAGIYRMTAPGSPASRIVPGVLVTNFLVDSRGQVWFSTTERGVGRLDEDGAASFFTAGDGLSADFTTALVEDRQGGVWVGTAAEGLNVLLRPRVGSLTPADGLSSPVVLSIEEGRSGTMWVGTAGGGLNRVAASGRVDQPLAGRLPASIVLALLVDVDGTLWVGTRAGILRYGEDGTTRAFTAVDGLPTNAILSLTEDPRGGVWVGTLAGPARIDEGAVTSFAEEGGLPSGPVYALHADSSGVWMGISGAGLHFFDGVGAEAMAPEALDGVQIFTIQPRGEGGLWLGTANAGLLRYHAGEVDSIQRAEGLPGDAVFSIVDDGAGRFWFCHNLGIYSIEIDALEAVADGERDRVSPVILGAAEGMPSSECNGGFQPASARGPDGTIWFPTMGGVAVVDPETSLDLPVRPEALVERVVIEDEIRSTGAVTGAELAAGTRRLEFHYTVPDPSLLGQVGFRYRLRGLDEAWIDAGDRRTAFFTNVGPGEYTFELQAYGSKGGATGPLTALPFRVGAHPWENPWLVGLAILGLLLTIAVVVQRRMRALSRRNEELRALMRERDRAERSAARAEVQYRNLMETAQELVIQADDEGAVLSMNQAARDLLGVDPDEVAGMRFRDLLAPTEGEDRDAVTILDSLSRQIQEVALRGADGSAIPAELSGQSISPETGGPGYLVLGRDLTSRRQLETQLRQAQKMDTVGRLAAGVAHDFNNLLTVITNSAELMEVGEEGRTDLEEIREAARRGADLTRQLLAFSRPDRRGGEMATVDLNDLVEGVEGMLRRLLGASMELRTDLDPRELPVRVDENQMSQVVMNLAANAKDATPAGGRVTISTGVRTIPPGTRVGREPLPAGVYATLSVEDTGEGIEEEHLDHIFDTFFTTKAEGAGTGLGLSTVLEIVRDHGGDLTVDTEPGERTSFTIFLPLLPRSA